MLAMTAAHVSSCSSRFSHALYKCGGERGGGGAEAGTHAQHDGIVMSSEVIPKSNLVLKCTLESKLTTASTFGRA